MNQLQEFSLLASSYSCSSSSCTWNLWAFVVVVSGTMGTLKSAIEWNCTYSQHFCIKSFSTDTQKQQQQSRQRHNNMQAIIPWLGGCHFLYHPRAAPTCHGLAVQKLLHIKREGVWKIDTYAERVWAEDETRMGAKVRLGHELVNYIIIIFFFALPDWLWREWRR